MARSERKPGLSPAELRRLGSERYPYSYAAANAFVRSALGWVPPAGMRLTTDQRAAVLAGVEFRDAALSKEGRP